MLCSVRHACSAWALILVCAASAAAQAPPNDDCANAVSLTVGGSPIAGTTVNATDSLVNHPCTAATVDVWYAFNATGPGSFTATATSGSGQLMSLTAYDACAGNVKSFDLCSEAIPSYRMRRLRQLSLTDFPYLDKTLLPGVSSIDWHRP